MCKHLRLPWHLLPFSLFLEPCADLLGTHWLRREKALPLFQLDPYNMCPWNRLLLTITHSGVSLKKVRKNTDQNMHCPLWRGSQWHKSTLVHGEGLMAWWLDRDLERTGLENWWQGCLVTRRIWVDLWEWAWGVEIYVSHMNANYRASLQWRFLIIWWESATTFPATQLFLYMCMCKRLWCWGWRLS